MRRRLPMIETFDWIGRWEKDVIPILDHPKVKASLKWFRQVMARECPHLVGTGALPYEYGILGFHDAYLPQLVWGEDDEPLEDENGDYVYEGDPYTKHTFNAYRPFSKCFYIARFAQAVGEVLYPNLLWRCIGDELHGIAVGIVRGDTTGYQFGRVGRIAIVSDINLQPTDNIDKGLTAEESLAFCLYRSYCGWLRACYMETHLGHVEWWQKYHELSVTGTWQ